MPTSRPDPYAGYKLIGPPKVIDAVILQINDQVITVNEILHAVRTELQQIPRNIGQDAFVTRAQEIVTREVRRQVGEAMMLDEAKRRLSEDDKKEVDKEFDDFLRERIAASGGSKAKLDEDLRQQDSSLDELTAQRRRALTSTFYMRKKFMPQVSVTRDMLWRYYRRHPEKFSSGQKVQMQIVAVPYRQFYPDSAQAPSPAELQAAKQQAHQKALKALKQIRDGQDFAQVVKDASTGYHAERDGVWDMMAAGNFRETAVEQAAFALPEGGVSNVIDGEAGCFIVKALKVAPGVTTPFEEAQDQIDDDLRQEQIEQLTANYLNELFNRAAISSSSEFERHIVDRVVQKFYQP